MKVKRLSASRQLCQVSLTASVISANQVTCDKSCSTSQSNTNTTPTRSGKSKTCWCETQHEQGGCWSPVRELPSSPTGLSKFRGRSCRAQVGRTRLLSDQKNSSSFGLQHDHRNLCPKMRLNNGLAMRRQAVGCLRDRTVPNLCG